MLNLQTMMTLSSNAGAATTHLSESDKAALAGTDVSGLLTASGKHLTFAQMLGQVLAVPASESEHVQLLSEELTALLDQLTALLQQEEADNEATGNGWLALAEQLAALLQTSVLLQSEGERAFAAPAVQEQLAKLAAAVQEKMPALVKQLEQAPEAVQQRLLQLVESLSQVVQARAEQMSAQTGQPLTQIGTGSYIEGDAVKFAGVTTDRMSPAAVVSDEVVQSNKAVTLVDPATVGKQTAVQSTESSVVRLSQLLVMLGATTQATGKNEELPLPMRGIVQMLGTASTGNFNNQWMSVAATGEQAGEEQSNSRSLASDSSLFVQQQQTAGVSAGSSQASFGNQLAAADGNQGQTVQIPVKQFADEMNRLIVSRWQLQSSDGVTELKIKLHPEHLGQVDVQLRMQNGQLVAQFVTDRLIGREMIESQLSYLRSSLQSQGIQVERIEVTQQSSSSGAWSEQHSSSRHSQQQYPHPNQTAKSGYAEAEDALAFLEPSDAPQRSLHTGGGFDAMA